MKEFSEESLSNGSWSWAKIYNGGGWDAEVYAWNNGGQVVLFYSGISYQDGDGQNYIGAISLDEGATWKTVLKSANTKAVVTHGWYNDVTQGANPYSFKFQNKGGLVGYDNKVIMAQYDHTLQKTYAVLQGTISGSNTNNASVSWSDYTDNLPFGGLTTARVVQNGTNKYLYASTAGAGAWRRQLGATSTVIPTSVSISGCQSSLSVGANTSLTATVLPSNATNKNVTWSSSNSNVASVNSSGVVSAVAAGSAIINVTTVSGNKTATCSVTVTAGGANQAPVVNITSPSNNANLTVGNNITVNYTAPDDNAVTKVELYVGSTLISTDNSAPFNSLTWNNASQGSGQYLSIVAYDAANLTTTQFIQVNVNASGGGGTTYRYLMITTSGGSVSQPITIQNIWWGSGSAGHPWPALTSSSTAVYGSPDDSNAYRAYDNSAAGWVVGSSATSWLWLDLGAGNGINPDKISIKPNAPDRGFKNFQCYGSNDANNWVLLHEETNLTTASYSNGGWGVFNFNSGSRKIGNPDVLMATDLKLYPNPMTIGSDLTIDASQLSKFNMQIIGLDGRLIYEKQFSSVESSIKINVAELNQTGVYLVKFNSGMKQWAQKLIVK